MGVDASDIVKAAEKADLRLVRFLWCGNDGTIRAKASSRHGLAHLERHRRARPPTDRRRARSARSASCPTPRRSACCPTRRSGAMLVDQRTLDGESAPVDGRAFGKRMAAALHERGARLEVAFESQFALAVAMNGGSSRSTRASASRRSA